MAFARVAEFGDFQAEYEGSIPFNRSNRYFNSLARNLKLPFQRHSDNFDTSRLKVEYKFASVFVLYLTSLLFWMNVSNNCSSAAVRG